LATPKYTTPVEKFLAPKYVLTSYTLIATMHRSYDWYLV